MIEKQKGQLLERLAKLRQSITKKDTTPLDGLTSSGEAPARTGAHGSAQSVEFATYDSAEDHESGLHTEGCLEGNSPATQLGDEHDAFDPHAHPGPKSLDGIMDRLHELAPELLKKKRETYADLARDKRAADRVEGYDANANGNGTGAAVHVGSSPADPQCSMPDFIPHQVTSLVDAGLNESIVEELVLKYLLTMGESTGQTIAEQIRLPFPLISNLVGRMKADQLLHYRGTTSINDYICALTELGRERARRHSMHCTYFGAAPVPLKVYRESVHKQSLRLQNPSREDLERAFSDLVISPHMLLRLGAAMNSGRGMFLYGYPGNGKTSIAERVTRAFGEFIWVPRAILVDGEIVRVFDPTQHEEAPLTKGSDIIRNHKVDERWVRIRRPTIIVGGELTMANLELSTNAATGINEAPVQLKSNCGILVIDDFGRQRISVTELLNRWIIPLEKRVDYLNLPSGKKVEVPFDQLVVFSTNLEPKDLVDDAFLRRIPYKINVENPTEEQFRKLFQMMGPKFGIEPDESAIDYLIETHYRPKNRPFRCCHPRDLLLQVQNLCKFQQSPLVLSRENIDFAVENYFSMM